MKFTYETQGAITYLVCELESKEQIDSLTLGMLTNNHITGLAPVLYTEMNGQCFLKYNISAKISSDQFFGGSINKQRILTAFRNIIHTICSADEYMIDLNCFSVVPEHVFLNVSNCETALICVPVTNDRDINHEVVTFFKKIMFEAQFDPSEDTSFMAELLAYINNSSVFNVYGMKDLVDRLLSSAGTVQNTRPVMQQMYGTVSANVQQPSVPVSSFDSTISIDDMPGMMGQIPPVVQQTHVAPISVQPSVQNMPPVQPVVLTPPQQSVVPTGSGFINRGGVVQMGGNKAQHVDPVPSMPNSPGFAIPGQPVGMAAKAQNNAEPTVSAEAGGEKKISLFGLLANYNKENAELYKKQKAEAKKDKSAAVVNETVPQTETNKEKNKKEKAKKEKVKKDKKSKKNADQSLPASAPVTTPAPVQSNSVMGGVPGQNLFVGQQPRPIQPVPVMNSFNETTVLSPAMAGGETTVLGPESLVSNPYLTRIKTGERIVINKPVFRIGKEKSYVDYFIGDNTAISRSHANIYTENGEYFIEDTNSTNHTYINGILINSNIKTKISAGDKIKLANEDFTFSL